MCLRTLRPFCLACLWGLAWDGAGFSHPKQRCTARWQGAWGPGETDGREQFQGRAPCGLVLLLGLEGHSNWPPKRGREGIPGRGHSFGRNGLRADVNWKQVWRETRLNVVGRQQAIRLEPLGASGEPEAKGDARRIRTCRGLGGWSPSHSGEAGDGGRGGARLEGLLGTKPGRT